METRKGPKMMKPMHKMVLMGAAVTVMVVSLAAPAMAADDELRAIKPNDASSGAQEEGPTAARDHATDGGAASNDGGSSSPAAEEPVKDRGISQCDIAPSDCRDTAEEEDSATHESQAVCIKAPCPASSSDSSSEEDSASHEEPQVVCIKAPCPASSGDSASGEEEDHVKDQGIKPCDIAPPGCKNTEEDSAQTPLSGSSGDEVGQLASSSGQIANSEANSSPTVYGCPYDYTYDEDFDTCLPSAEDFGAIPVFVGDKPWPDSPGGYVGLLGGIVNDLSIEVGAGILQIGLGHYVGDTLVDFGEGGGPIGWGIQGLGYTLGFAGDAAGVLVEGAGQVVGAVADGVGEAIDAVGDAAEDAWDEVSSWF